MRIAVYLLSILMLVVSGACNKRPPHVISEKKMVEILTDIQLAESYFVSVEGMRNVDRNMIAESVIKKHGVTREDLDSTISYYGRNIDEYYVLYDKVEKNLQKKNPNLRAAEPSEKADIWPYNHFTLLSSGQSTDGITFSFVPENLTKGESLEWIMRLSSPETGDASFGVSYEDGSVTINKTNISGYNALSIELQTDTGKVVKRVFGNMTLQRQEKPVFIDSIRILTTEYDSLNYSKLYRQYSASSPGKRKPAVVTENDTAK